LVLKFRGIPYNTRSDTDTGWILYECDEEGSCVKIIGRQKRHEDTTVTLYHGYTSFINGLEYIDQQNITTENLGIECDSELIINQLMGIHNSHAIKNLTSLKLYARSKGLLNKLRYQKSYNKVFFEHVVYKKKKVEEEDEQKKTNE
jgi:ribonuclease HI